MRFSIRSCFALFLASVIAGHAAHARVLYVNAAAGGSVHDGASWSTAYTHIQSATAAAASGDDVWVAKGTYVENVTVPTTLGLYGGFAGTETARSQRSAATNVTILDGNQVSSVVSITANSVTVDGFTIRNGKGTAGTIGPVPSYKGGGIYSISAATTISNNVITNNVLPTDTGSYGGGVYCSGDNSVVSHNTMDGNDAGNGSMSGAGSYGGAGGGIEMSGRNEVISYNTVHATVRGGGIDVNALDGGNDLIAFNTVDHSAQAFGINVASNGNNVATVNNNTVTYGYDGIRCSGGVLIQSNLIAHNSGAGIADDSLYGAVTYPSTIINNTAIYNAFGLKCYAAKVYAANNIVSYNTYGIDNEDSSNALQLHHDDVYQNTTNFYGPYNGGGFYKSIPVFVNDAAGDYHLMSSSPLIDLGQDINSEPFQTDLDGHARVQGGHVDVGAYEYTGTERLALVFTTQPVGGRVGQPLAQQPVVTLFHQDGSPSSDTSQITIAIASGTGTSGAALTGTRIVNAVNGVAVFTNLGIDHTGAGYILSASGTNLFPTTSVPVTITGPPTALAIVNAPIAGLANTTLPVFTVEIRDSDGLVVNDDSDPITLSLSGGPGSLHGTVTVNAVHGVASFSNLSIDAVGSYVLTASSGSLPAATTAMAIVPPVLRVSPSGNDANDGGSWSSALKSVQTALDRAAASGGDEVWIAAGTYTGNFTLRSGVGLYGGFSGAESNRGSRNASANLTILDGGASGSVVTTASDAGPATVIDGFTIQHGRGTLVFVGDETGYCCDTHGCETVPYPTYQYQGGGLLLQGSPIVSNNIITANDVNHSDSHIQGNGCGGYNNWWGSGGGLYTRSSPTVVSNTFISVLI